MTWWTTATLTDGLISEIAAVVTLVAASAAAAVAGGLVVHQFGRLRSYGCGPVWLNAVGVAVSLMVALTLANVGVALWPDGHPVGVAFMALVAAVAAVPVVAACAFVVALIQRIAVATAVAVHGTAADQLDEFIESVRRGSPDTRT